MAESRKSAAAKRAESNDQQRDALIPALLTERAGYVARKDTDRIKQVDAQLKAHGYTDPKPAAKPRATTEEK